VLKPVEREGNHIFSLMVRRRFGMVLRVYDRLKESLSEYINKICQDPFVLFAQNSLQINQIGGCLFIISLLYTNCTCPPDRPKDFLSKSITLSQVQGSLNGCQRTGSLTGIILIHSAYQQYLASIAWMIALQLFRFAKKLLYGFRGDDSIFITESNPDGM
jgi:hypothetical protein